MADGSELFVIRNKKLIVTKEKPQQNAAHKKLLYLIEYQLNAH